MMPQYFEEKGTEKPSNSNGKTVNLYAKIYSRNFSVDYADKKYHMMILKERLTDNGYTVNYTYDPQEGKNGEFYLYLVTEQKQILIFSNDKAYENSTIVAENIDSIPGKLQEVYEKIINNN